MSLPKSILVILVDDDNKLMILDDADGAELIVSLSVDSID